MDLAIAIAARVIYIALLLYIVLLWVRFGLDWARALRPSWRPTGVLLFVAEVAFTLTDPPIKLLRRVLPPVRLGAVQLDFSWSLVLLVCIVLLYVVGGI